MRLELIEAVSSKRGCLWKRGALIGREGGAAEAGDYREGGAAAAIDENKGSLGRTKPRFRPKALF